jgi:urease accessory protein
MAHDVESVHAVNGVDRTARVSSAPRGSWRAEIELRIDARGPSSVLARCRHQGPLRVQRPFYPEGPAVCHVCLLHPPGGLVPGDELQIEIGVGSGARALVTTPAAGKAYRTDGRRAAQRQLLWVASGASLEWLPQETILFDGALFESDTRVVLERGASFVGWDVQCFGRPAIGERYTAGGFKTRLEIHRDGVPLYVDRAICDGGADVLRASYGLADHPAFGTMLVAPARREWLDVVRELVPARPSNELVSATLLAGGELLCCRYLGSSAGRARGHFAAIWAALRPALLGRAASPPRIWST